MLFGPPLKSDCVIGGQDESRHPLIIRHDERRIWLSHNVRPDIDVTKQVWIVKFGRSVSTGVPCLQTHSVCAWQVMDCRWSDTCAFRCFYHSEQVTFADAAVEAALAD